MTLFEKIFCTWLLFLMPMIVIFILINPFTHPIIEKIFLVLIIGPIILILCIGFVAVLIEIWTS